jgi:hypothetical protein
MSCVEFMIVTAEVATHEKRNDEIILFYTLICLESNKSLIVIMYKSILQETLRLYSTIPIRLVNFYGFT